MRRVQIFDPFAESGVDDLFRGFFAPVRRKADAPVTIKVDVSENDKGYVVRAEIPGVKKEDNGVLELKLAKKAAVTGCKLAIS